MESALYGIYVLIVLYQKSHSLGAAVTLDF